MGVGSKFSFFLWFSNYPWSAHCWLSESGVFWSKQSAGLRPSWNNFGQPYDRCSTLDWLRQDFSASDVVGLGVSGGEEMVCSSGLRWLRPRASPTGQEGSTAHRQEATSPADKHCLTKLKAANENRHKRSDPHVNKSVNLCVFQFVFLLTFAGDGTDVHSEQSF